MNLKDELLDKLAKMDTKEKVKGALNEHKDEIREELYLNRKDKGILDGLQEKIVSRKLLVFGVASWLLYANSGLDADTWAWIAMTYIGGQTAIDFAKVWKG